MLCAVKEVKFKTSTVYLHEIRDDKVDLYA